MINQFRNSSLSKMSAFEITARQREEAKNNEAGYPVLDAGRGNPNWINTEARYAFARFMEFAVGQSERKYSNGSMAGQATLEGIGQRFLAAMDEGQKTDAFLLRAIRYCVDELGLSLDGLIKELTDGIIGDYYPMPSRCLVHVEKILNAYLESALYNGVQLKDETQIFPTEGGSAAMCYIFNSLSHNCILHPGDQIAIGTPIFTPYLEIPELYNFGLVPIDISCSEKDHWEIPDSELWKLEDRRIKAFFLVNPSNPASHALSYHSLEVLKEVVKKNPDLIILTDDVYGTFVDGFQTIYSALPHNTILVYSFSKLYGATGWRIGAVAMHRENVCDRLLANLSVEDKAFLKREYASVTPDVEALPFIERLVADSRSIGLYHTSGLSTPAQVFMAFLSLSHLIYGAADPYFELSKRIFSKRYGALMAGLGLPADCSRSNAQYYALVNVNELCENMYGADFAKWKRSAVSDLDFLNELALKKGLVLMYGPGFDAPDGYVRVSLANLNVQDYYEVARRVKELVQDYYQIYCKC